MACPGMETLAAFVDGTLSAAERRGAMAHLATCEACYEVVTETLHAQEELEEELEPAPQTGRVVAFPRRQWVTGLIGLAAAAVLVVTVGPLLLTGGGLDQMAQGVVPPESEEPWTAPQGPNYRGWTRSLSDRSAAIWEEDCQIGAALADLRLAVHGGDRTTVADRAGVLESKLSAALIDSPIYAVTAIRDGALDTPLEELQRQVKDLEERLEPFFEEGGLRLGYWAEVGRVAALGGDLEPLRRRPWRKELKALRAMELPESLAGHLENVQVALDGGDPLEIRKALEGVVTWQSPDTD